MNPNEAVEKTNSEPFLPTLSAGLLLARPLANAPRQFVVKPQ